MLRNTLPNADTISSSVISDDMTPASLTPNIGDVSTTISEVSVPSSSHLIGCSSLELSRASILSEYSKEFATDVSFQSAASNEIDPKYSQIQKSIPNTRRYKV